MSTETEPGRGGEIRRALDQALNDVAELTLPRDAALKELARMLADLIDAGAEPVKLIPQLADVLDRLLMSPRSRAAVVGRKGGTDVNRTDKAARLAERRERRARQYGPAAVDPAAPGTDA
jgi:hypothetical protein